MDDLHEVLAELSNTGQQAALELRLARKQEWAWKRHSKKVGKGARSGDPAVIAKVVSSRNLNRAKRKLKNRLYAMKGNNHGAL